MKIVHTEASCGWGGQEIRILEESRGMIARGHEVTLFCPPEARIFTEATRYGARVMALPIGRKKPVGVLALRHQLAYLRPDLVNTHSSTDTWLTALACATLSAAPPIVRTRHISAPVSKNVTSRWLYTRATAHVVTTGERLRQSLINDLGLLPDRVTSVPTGINTQRFKPGDKILARQVLGLAVDARWIGIVATLRSWKGHLFLLEALAALDRRDVHLAIVGDGPYTEVIREKAATLGLQDQVIMAGHRQDAEIWMRAFDLFCLPSYANEGVPQALMQAMLTGLPVVSTPVGSIEEIIDEGRSGLVVPPQDAASLAGALNRLLNDTDLALRLGIAARSEAQARFGFDLMVDRMEAIFHKAIEERR